MLTFRRIISKPLTSYDAAFTFSLRTFKRITILFSSLLDDLFSRRIASRTNQAHHILQYVLLHLLLNTLVPALFRQTG